ncbi:MAG TPA: GntR family transcriptional regulator [Aggregatilinea sp.]|uniref:GntR family transcriptional regulator n=1 Tax=Aggregatilinea sp. TaxID=2806333 RepID=UPI002CCD8B71|nr:GntR family transcriptional regulator [Aggregatilinea sp.]HML21963.1 GntR family transcriptional regulator [Aggregatilinea sp.]
MTIDRDSTVPLYIQLKEHLRQQIENGSYAPGSRLPSERELADTFQVSRMTARQAIRLLATDGFISAHVGKGTFVLKPRIDQELLLLTSFTEDIRQRGMTPRSRIIRAGIERANQEEAEQLKVSEGAEVIMLSRVRLADEDPIAWEICTINHRMCPGILDRHNFGQDSLYQVMRDEYGIRLLWADQLISARMPSREEREALDLDTKTPVLSLTRVTYTDHDQPAEYVRSVYRCDRYQLRTILRYTNG